MTKGETEDEASIVTQASSVFGGDGYFLDYEPTLLGGNPTLHRFQPVKKGTHCPFAATAKLWGGKSIEKNPRRYKTNEELVQEAAVLNSGPFAEFVARVTEGERLDWFCVEIPRAEYFQVEILGRSVFYFLAKLAELDPCLDENVMKMGPIDHRRFRFVGEDFFITTFSPVYEKDSSRQTFGAQHAFSLFQPMTSFGRHNLGMDTPASATNWTNPTTMRDKTRVAFRNYGCPYHIPEQLPYPVAEHIVKSAKDNGTTCIRWWDHLVESKADGATGME